MPGFAGNIIAISQKNGGEVLFGQRTVAFRDPAKPRVILAAAPYVARLLPVTFTALNILESKTLCSLLPIRMGDRKSRLAALAAKAGRTKMTDLSTEMRDQGEEGAVTESKKAHSVSFRNYAPNDERLAGDHLGNEDEDGPDTKRQRVGEPSISTALQDALKEAKQEVASTTYERRLLMEDTATPKKLNWDLLRDIHDKLNKLEKRTQKAIVEMLKERLEKEAAEQAQSDDSDLD